MKIVWMDWWTLVCGHLWALSRHSEELTAARICQGIIVGWPLFFLVLRDVCMRASLIEPDFDAEESE